MKLLATHAFKCIVHRVNFGLTSYEDIPPALLTRSKLRNIKQLAVYIKHSHTIVASAVVDVSSSALCKEL